MSAQLTVAYNGTNILEDAPDGIVSVSYKGETLASLLNGEKTLLCGDTAMEDDVTVSYGDTDKKLLCKGKRMESDVVVTVVNLWDAPTISLSDSIVSTPIVEGVTKYKVYDNGTYIGYVDDENVWHEGAVV